ATRFSFLLSIPVIVLASGVAVLDLVEQSVSVDWGPMFGVVALSALSAFACIHFFLNFVNRIGMLPFVLYRFVLGAVLIVFVL
ncbi:MAG: undecaprenyl-diphosphate phosphatase, partial [Gammaproteobacteria bacterium]